MRFRPGPVAAALALAAMAPAPAVAKVPRFTAYLYKAKLSVKGGAHQQQSSPVDPGLPDGWVVEERVQASYSIDDIYSEFVIVKSGSMPGGSPRNATGTRVVVNGTWTNQGQVWDAGSKTTKDYTCSGTIGDQYGPAPTMKWRRRGAKLKVTADVINDALTVRGQESCPGAAFYLNQVDQPAYVTEFSIPLSSIGNKTITKPVSGPLAENRPPSDECRQSVGSSCTFGMAWQGVIKLTRVRKFKY